MDLSGLIFVALAVVWAVVLIPMALRHHDEAARTRAVDNFSDDLRVVARREAVTARESRLVVAARRRITSGASVDRDEVAAAPSVPTGPRDVPLAPEPGPAVPAPASVPTVPAMPRQPGPRDVRRVVANHRRAAQAAARRRRVVLGILLLVTLGVSAGVATGHLLTWAPTIPGGVLLGFLVLARVMVRREHHAFRAAVARHHAAATESWQAEVPIADTEDEIRDLVLEPAAAPTPTAAPSPSFVSGLDDSQAVPVGLRAEVAVDQGDQGVEGLWDPLPMTLPTYVTKPRAQRSVRTIDLLAPGVQSSGRSAADSALVAEAATAQPVDPGRAVNG